MIDAGQADLAFRLVLAAAVRVWSADPGPATRDYLIAVMARLPVPPDDPRLLAAGGFVDPARYGDLIARRIAALRPDQLDAAAAELAMSVHLVGADEAIAAVQRAVVDGARRAGKLTVLPRMATQQTWNAITLADWQAAVPSADEAVRLAVETRQPMWQAAALTGQAMIAGMRGDDADAERLAQHAEALVLPARISAVLCGSSSRAAARSPPGLRRGVRAAARYSTAPTPPTRRCRAPGSSVTWRRPRPAQNRRPKPAVLAAFRPGDHDSVTRRRVALFAAPLLADDQLATRCASALRTSRAGRSTRPRLLLIRLLAAPPSTSRRGPGPTRAHVRSARPMACCRGRSVPASNSAPPERRSEHPRAAVDVPVPQELQIAVLASEGLSIRNRPALCSSHRPSGSHLYRRSSRSWASPPASSCRRCWPPSTPARPPGRRPAQGRPVRGPFR